MSISDLAATRSPICASPRARANVIIAVVQGNLDNVVATGGISSFAASAQFLLSTA